MNEDLNTETLSRGEVQENMLAKTKSSKPLVILGVVILAVVIGSILFFSSKKDSSGANTTTPQKNITLAEIQKHNSASDCWTTIEGGVYDVTHFIPSHPGGNRILAACGTDATALFDGQSPMGRLHSQAARKILAGYKIGTLQN